MISLRTLIAGIVVINFLTLFAFIEISRNYEFHKTPAKIQPTFQEDIQQFPAGSLNPITEFGDKVIYSKRFNRPIKIKKTIPNHDLIPEDLKTEPNKTDSTNTTNITTPPIPINENNRTETPTNTTNTSVLNPANSTNTTVNITIPNASPQ